MTKILMVEDDKTIAMGVEYALKQEDINVDIAHTYETGLKKSRENQYDLIVLDIGLPDGDGYTLCREIRKRGEIPVIFLTAMDEEANVVMGLEIGADDYITKPFRLRELLSRIKTVLRRSGKNTAPAVISIGDITVDTSKAKVYKEGTELFLTTLEYKLFLSLVINRNAVLSRNQLLESLWDVGGEFVNDNTLTVYIKRLREKVEKNVQEPQIILTVRGIGYKLGDI